MINDFVIYKLQEKTFPDIFAIKFYYNSQLEILSKRDQEEGGCSMWMSCSKLWDYILDLAA